MAEAEIGIRWTVAPADQSALQWAIWRRLGLVGYVMPLAWPVLALLAVSAGVLLVTAQGAAGEISPFWAAAWRSGFLAGALAIWGSFLLFCVPMQPLQRRLFASELEWTYRLDATGPATDRADVLESSRADWRAVTEVRHLRKSTALFVARNRAYVILNSDVPEGMDQAEFKRRIEAWRAVARGGEV